MVNEVVQKLASYIIPIVVLIIVIVIYFNPQGAFENVKKVTNELPNINVGTPEIPGVKPSISPAHQEAITKLKEAIDVMQNSTKGSCFYRYAPFTAGNGFPALGEKGTTIRLTKENEGTRITILGGKEGVQEISSGIIADVFPCVISGVSNRPNAYKNPPTISEKFYNTYLAGLYAENHYNPVDSIEVKSVDGNNKIRYNNGQFLDVNDGGFLYTPDNQHICFFPTKRGIGDCDGYGEIGLDDDCLGYGDYTEGINIPHLVSTEQLPWCR